MFWRNPDHKGMHCWSVHFNNVCITLWYQDTDYHTKAQINNGIVSFQNAQIKMLNPCIVLLLHVLYGSKSTVYPF